MKELDRRQKLLKKINHKGSGLEIGPLCWPLLTKNDADIYYVDHVDTAELKRLYKDDKGVPPDLIPDVDYPLNGRSLKETVGKKKFDYILASHVIEHVPDMVRWLQNMASVLKPGGILSLAIPDKRFTFDIDRNVSRPGEMIGAYIDELKKPSSTTIYDFASSFRSDVVPIDIVKTDMDLDEHKSPHRYDSQKAYDMCLDSRERGIYVDTHCYVFTPSSFFVLLREMIGFGLFDFKVAAFYDTVDGTYEFIVSLEKMAKKDQKIQLASLPKLAKPLLEREAEHAILQLQKHNKELSDENKIIKAELTNIRQSHSWRITKPIRAVSSLKKRLNQ